MEAFDGVSRPILDLVVVSMLSRSVMRSKHVVDEYIIVSDSGPFSTISVILQWSGSDLVSHVTGQRTSADNYKVI